MSHAQLVLGRNKGAQVYYSWALLHFFMLLCRLQKGPGVGMRAHDVEVAAPDVGLHVGLALGDVGLGGLVARQQRARVPSVLLDLGHRDALLLVDDEDAVQQVGALRRELQGAAGAKSG